MRTLILTTGLLGALVLIQANAATLVSCATSNTNTGKVTPTTPSDRFTDNGDGTVTDNGTGLMWQVCPIGYGWSSGICSLQSVGTYSWTNALAEVGTVNGATYAGHSDWRLPNVKELASIVERACSAPASNELVFPQAPSGKFWSSSIQVAAGSATSSAWYVDFSTATTTTDLQSISAYVRLVRDTP